MNTTTAAANTTPTGVFGLSSVDATLVAAMAALIAASLAFLGVTLARRQTERHWRTENRQQRVITASTQLAHESAAVRIAGVAALESLIDDYLNSARTRILGQWHLHHTSRLVGMQIRVRGRPIGRRVRGYRLRSTDFLLAQQAVNVLCAYLRSPGAPPPASAPTLVTETITSRLGRRPGETTGRDVVREHRYQPNDEQVRETIVNTIGAHLKDGTPGQRWSQLAYDFTGVEFHSVTVFDRAQFHGPVGFDRAQFHSPVGFQQAQFHAAAWFDEAQFHAAARFEGAHFHGYTKFGEVEFHSVTVFDRAQFQGPVGFDQAHFHDDTRFYEAQFQGLARFEGAQFHAHAWFDEAQFHADAGFHAEGAVTLLNPKDYPWVTRIETAPQGRLD